MSMDWSNESYVRLYTRDTTNWRRLGWDGQCVLMSLLRKVDRSGSLDLGGLDPWEAIVLHTGATEDSARRGVEALLRTESVTIRDDRLTFPSFIEAQECSKSDKLRAKESRERRAKGTDPLRFVIRESQDVTPPSRVVTSRHEPSHAVTPRHSLLCSAPPCSADPLQCNADGESARVDHSEDSGEEQKPQQRGPLADAIARLLPPQDALPPAKALPVTVPAQERPASGRVEGYPHPLKDRVRISFTRWHTEKTGNPPPQSRKQLDAYASIAAWLEAKDGDPDKMLETLLQRFFTDEWAKDHGYFVAALANNPPMYWAPPRPIAKKADYGERRAELYARIEVLKGDRAANNRPGNEAKLQQIETEIEKLQTTLRGMRGES